MNIDNNNNNINPNIRNNITPDPLSYNFIKNAAINITFSFGTSQRIYYLNYPRTSGNTPDELKTNVSGVVVLGKNASPIAYITTQPGGIGWQISGSDLAPTKISILEDNIYFGRNTGPSQAGTAKYNSISNSVFGNNS